MRGGGGGEGGGGSYSGPAKGYGAKSGWRKVGVQTEIAMNVDQEYS